MRSVHKHKHGRPWIGLRYTALCATDNFFPCMYNTYTKEKKIRVYISEMEQIESKTIFLKQKKEITAIESCEYNHWKKTYKIIRVDCDIIWM